MNDTLPALEYTITAEDGRVLVDVPWDQADALRTYLRSHGVETLLHLEPGYRKAWLELNTDMNPEEVRHLLEGWPVPPMRW
jgi:hypothetical protein